MTETDGFTLVELLVVIAIIAILASLLLAGLARARSAADSAVCKSNLRQWGIALRLYVDENGCYPQQGQWYVQLASYTGTPSLAWNEDRLPDGTWVQNPRWKGSVRRGIQVCPGFAHLWGNGPTRWLLSYGYNEVGVAYDAGRPGRVGLGGELVPVPHDHPIKENEVVAPSEMMAIGDAQLYPASTTIPLLQPSWRLNPFYEIGWHIVGGEDGISRIPSILSCEAKIRQRHNERWNVLFCDQHVESLRTRDLFDLRRNDVLMRWNRDHLPHRELAPEWIP